MRYSWDRPTDFAFVEVLALNSCCFFIKIHGCGMTGGKTPDVHPEGETPHLTVPLSCVRESSDVHLKKSIYTHMVGLTYRLRLC